MKTHDGLLDARMVGQRDVELIQLHVAETHEGTRFLECGPWLGYLSRIMARKGPVLVLDTFRWTSDHAKRAPGLHEPGDSFRGTFDLLNTTTPHPITAVETDFAEFDWDGPPFGFCLIDAPKSADKLAPLLKRILPTLKPNATILIVNGKNLKYAEMVGLISRLVQAGMLQWNDAIQIDKAKTAVLLRGDVDVDNSILDELVEAPTDLSEVPAKGILDNPVAIVSIMASCVERGQWAEAYTLLAQTETETRVRRLWEEAEANLNMSRLDPEQFGYFSHMVDTCHSAAESGRPPRAIHKNSTNAVEEFWFRNADKPWRATAFHPEIIARAQALGYMAWPSEVAGRLEGKRVLDVGCGTGLHGIGVLAAGATLYNGVDPKLNLESDKVKDLVKKNYVNFGHTGADLIELMAPYQLSAVPVERFDGVGEPYDVALMHMVTQHLADPEAAIEAVSRLLAPGAELILRHRNFYAWNGHQIAPNTVKAIDPRNSAHMELVDWRHLEFDAPPQHYIARELNRISLGEIRRILEMFFKIEIWFPTASTEDQGIGRLTDEIRGRHPELNDADFKTQTVFCVGKRL